MRFITFIFTVALLAPILAALPTKKVPVIDEYHGEKITDDYRWLEDGSSKDVKK